MLRINRLLFHLQWHVAANSLLVLLLHVIHLIIKTITELGAISRVLEALIRKLDVLPIQSMKVIVTYNIVHRFIAVILDRLLTLAARLIYGVQVWIVHV